MLLEPTPDVRRETVLIGTCIRKTPDIVHAYLQSLDRQRPIDGLDPTYHFILDTQDAEVVRLVEAFLTTHDGMAEFAPDPAPPYDDNHPVTHQWSPEAMGRVGQMKNRIIARAVATNAAALWFCDADLLCDPGTLRSLWYSDKPVACAVYWTKWNSDPKIMAAPQVWLRHPYDLTGRGYADDASFREQLLTKQLTQVWGQGACTLIRREVLLTGVTFDYLPDVPLDGMMAGEDRHFCLACERRHIPMYADPWPHIFHCYHPDDRDQLAWWSLALASPQDAPANWLNLRLAMLEPVPTGPNQWGQVAPVTVRIRVGCGEILPDLERQCLAHLDGQPFIATVHYPSTYPIQWLRNTKRLLEVVVVDSRFEDQPPVIRDEIVKGLDLSRYSREQQEAMDVG